MAGTRLGGMKARDTNKTRFGADFYRRIGVLGGKLSKGGGFAVDRELAVRAGQIGGKVSRRNKNANRPQP